MYALACGGIVPLDICGESRGPIVAHSLDEIEQAGRLIFSADEPWDSLEVDDLRQFIEDRGGDVVWLFNGAVDGFADVDAICVDAF